jgi:hypothetical protein
MQNTGAEDLQTPAGGAVEEGKLNEHRFDDCHMKAKNISTTTQKDASRY